jgi:hypothetical protein
VNGWTIPADPEEFDLIVKCNYSIGQSFGSTEACGDARMIQEDCDGWETRDALLQSSSN